MSHCKKVRDMKADIKRSLRWIRSTGWGRGEQPKVIAYTLPDGQRATAFRWEHYTGLNLEDGKLTAWLGGEP
jgi:hypothetical protein